MRRNANTSEFTSGGGGGAFGPLNAYIFIYIYAMYMDMHVLCIHDIH